MAISAKDAHNVKVVGSGNITVVLGHGFGTDQSVWRYLVPHLVDQYKVILYDNMGAGTTNPDYFNFERYTTLEGYANDLLAILDEFHVDKCIFVGHSLSSMIGAIASIHRPDRFHKLIMISAFSRPTKSQDRLCYGGFEHEEINQLCGALLRNYISWALNSAGHRST